MANMSAIDTALVLLSDQTDEAVPRSVLTLFSESNTRFVCEVAVDKRNAFESALVGVPHARIGEVTDSGRLVAMDQETKLIDVDIAVLKEAWQSPLRW